MSRDEGKLREGGWERDGGRFERGAQNSNEQPWGSVIEIYVCSVWNTAAVCGGCAQRRHSAASAERHTIGVTTAISTHFAAILRSPGARTANASGCVTPKSADNLSGMRLTIGCKALFYSRDKMSSNISTLRCSWDETAVVEATLAS